MSKIIEYMAAGFEALRCYLALRLVGYERDDAMLLVIKLKEEGVREYIERRIKNGNPSTED